MAKKKDTRKKKKFNSGGALKSYAKNLGKSALLLGKDVMFDNDFGLTSVDEIIRDNTDLAIKGFEAYKDRENIFKMIKNTVDKQVFSQVKDLKKNVMSDIKSGKIYNKSREENEFMKSFGGEDMLGDDFFDGLDDFEDELTGSVDKSLSDFGDDLSSSISDSLSGFSNDIVKSNTKSAVASINADIKMHKQSMEGMSVINDAISNIATFNESRMSPFLDKAMDYYDKSLELAERRNQLLEEMVGYAKEQEEIDDRSSAEKALGWNYSSFNIAEYSKAVKQSTFNVLSELTGMDFSDMGGTMGGGNMIKGIIANPIGNAVRMGIVKALPSAFKEASKELNKTISSFFPALMLKLSDIAENSFGTVKGYLAKIFGLNFKDSHKVDLGGYEKGKVAFDGITKKTIVDVIPTYLRKILSAITKSDEIVFDRSTGKFTTLAAAKQSANEVTEGSFMDYSDTKDKIKGHVSSTTEMTAEQTSNFERLIDDVFDSISKNVSGLVDRKLDFKKLKDVDTTDAEAAMLSRAFQALSKADMMNLQREHAMSKRNRAENVKDFNSNMEQRLGLQYFLTEDVDKLTKSGSYSPAALSSYAQKNKRVKLSDSMAKKVNFKEGMTVDDKAKERLERERAWKEAHKKDPNLKKEEFLKGYDGNEGFKNSVMSKIPGAESFQKSTDSFLKNVQKIISKPFNFLEKQFKKFDGFLYDVIFDSEFTKTYKKKMSDFFTGMKEKVFGVRDKDGSWEKAGFLSSTRDIFRDFGNKTANFLWGKEYTDKDGNLVSRKEKPIFGVIKEKFSHYTTKAKNFLFGEKDVDGNITKTGFLTQTKEKLLDLTERTKLYLFGEKDDKGNVISGKEGVIPEKYQKMFKRFAPKAGIGAGAGLLASIFMPFGGMVGAFGGAAVGAILEMDKVKDFLWGEENDEGKRENGIFVKAKNKLDKTIKRMDKYLFGENKEGAFGVLGMSREKAGKGIGIGAGAGLIGSLFLPGGPFLGTLLGAATGFASQTKKFQEFLFGDGKSDKNLLRNGLIPTAKEFIVNDILNPIRDYAVGSFRYVKDFVNTKLVVPFNLAFKPIVVEAGLQIKKTFKGITNFVKNLWTSFMDTMGEKMNDLFGASAKRFILAPLGNYFKDKLEAIGSFVGKGLQKPMQKLNAFAGRLREKHIAQGNDGYMAEGTKYGALLKAYHSRNENDDWKKMTSMKGSHADYVKRASDERQKKHDEWVKRNGGFNPFSKDYQLKAKKQKLRSKEQYDALSNEQKADIKAELFKTLKSSNSEVIEGIQHTAGVEADQQINEKRESISERFGKLAKGKQNALRNIANNAASSDADRIAAFNSEKVSNISQKVSGIFEYIKAIAKNTSKDPTKMEKMDSDIGQIMTNESDADHIIDKDEIFKKAENKATRTFSKRKVEAKRYAESLGIDLDTITEEDMSNKYLRDIRTSKLKGARSAYEGARDKNDLSKAYSIVETAQSKYGAKLHDLDRGELGKQSYLNSLGDRLTTNKETGITQTKLASAREAFNKAVQDNDIKKATAIEMATKKKYGNDISFGSLPSAVQSATTSGILNKTDDEMAKGGLNVSEQDALKDREKKAEKLEQSQDATIETAKNTSVFGKIGDAFKKGSGWLWGFVSKALKWGGLILPIVAIGKKIYDFVKNWNTASQGAANAVDAGKHFFVNAKDEIKEYANSRGSRVGELLYDTGRIIINPITSPKLNKKFAQGTVKATGAAASTFKSFMGKSPYLDALKTSFNPLNYTKSGKNLGSEFIERSVKNYNGVGLADDVAEKLVKEVAGREGIDATSAYATKQTSKLASKLGLKRRAIQEAGGELSEKALAKYSPNWFARSLDAVANSKVAQKYLGGTKLGSKALSEISQEAAKSASKRMVKEGSERVGMELATKLAGPLVNGALFGVDMARGYNEANRILNLPSDYQPTFRMKAAAALGKGFSELLLGLVNPGWISERIYNVIGSNQDKLELQKQQEALALEAGVTLESLYSDDAEIRSAAKAQLKGYSESVNKTAMTKLGEWAKTDGGKTAASIATKIAAWKIPGLSGAVSFVSGAADGKKTKEQLGMLSDASLGITGRIAGGFAQQLQTLTFGVFQYSDTIHGIHGITLLIKDGLVKVKDGIVNVCKWFGNLPENLAKLVENWESAISGALSGTRMEFLTQPIIKAINGIKTAFEFVYDSVKYVFGGMAKALGLDNLWQKAEARSSQEVSKKNLEALKNRMTPEMDLAGTNKLTGFDWKNNPTMAGLDDPQKKNLVNYASGYTEGVDVIQPNSLDASYGLTAETIRSVVSTSKNYNAQMGITDNSSINVESLANDQVKAAYAIESQRAEMYAAISQGDDKKVQELANSEAGKLLMQNDEEYKKLVEKSNAMIASMNEEKEPIPIGKKIGMGIVGGILALPIAKMFIPVGKSLLSSFKVLTAPLQAIGRIIAPKLFKTKTGAKIKGKYKEITNVFTGQGGVADVMKNKFNEVGDALLNKIAKMQGFGDKSSPIKQSTEDINKKIEERAKYKAASERNKANKEELAQLESESKGFKSWLHPIKRHKARKELARRNNRTTVGLSNAMTDSLDSDVLSASQHLDNAEMLYGKDSKQYKAIKKQLEMKQAQAQKAKSGTLSANDLNPVKNATNKKTKAERKAEYEAKVKAKAEREALKNQKSLVVMDDKDITTSSSSSPSIAGSFYGNLSSDEAKAEKKALSKNLIAKRNSLNDQYKAGSISWDQYNKELDDAQTDFQKRKQELNKITTDTVKSINKSMDEVSEGIKDGGKDIKKSSDTAVKDVTKGSTSLKKSVDNAGKDIKKEATSASKDVTKGSEELSKNTKKQGKTIKERLTEMKDNVVKGATELKDKAKAKGKEIKQSLVGAKDNVVKGATDFANKVKTVGKKTGKEVTETGLVVYNAAQKSAVQIDNAGDKVANEIKELGTDTANAANQASAVMNSAGGAGGTVAKAGLLSKLGSGLKKVAGTKGGKVGLIIGGIAIAGGITAAIVKGKKKAETTKMEELSAEEKEAAKRILNNLNDGTITTADLSEAEISLLQAYKSALANSSKGKISKVANMASSGAMGYTASGIADSYLSSQDNSEMEALDSYLSEVDPNATAQGSGIGGTALGLAGTVAPMLLTNTGLGSKAWDGIKGFVAKKGAKKAASKVAQKAAAKGAAKVASSAVAKKAGGGLLSKLGGKLGGKLLGKGATKAATSAVAGAAAKGGLGSALSTIGGVASKATPWVAAAYLGYKGIKGAINANDTFGVGKDFKTTGGMRAASAVTNLIPFLSDEKKGKVSTWLYSTFGGDKKNVEKIKAAQNGYSDAEAGLYAERDAKLEAEQQKKTFELQAKIQEVMGTRSVNSMNDLKELEAQKEVDQQTKDMLIDITKGTINEAVSTAWVTANENAMKKWKQALGINTGFNIMKGIKETVKDTFKDGWSLLPPVALVRGAKSLWNRFDEATTVDSVAQKSITELTNKTMSSWETAFANSLPIYDEINNSGMFDEPSADGITLRDSLKSVSKEGLKEGIATGWVVANENALKKWKQALGVDTGFNIMKGIKDVTKDAFKDGWSLIPGVALVRGAKSLWDRFDEATTVNEVAQKSVNSLSDKTMTKWESAFSDSVSIYDEIDTSQVFDEPSAEGITMRESLKSLAITGMQEGLSTGWAVANQQAMTKFKQALGVDTKTNVLSFIKESAKAASWVDPDTGKFKLGGIFGLAKAGYDALTKATTVDTGVQDIVNTLTDKTLDQWKARFKESNLLFKDIADIDLMEDKSGGKSVSDVLKGISINKMKEGLSLAWGVANDQAMNKFKQALGIDPMSKTLDVLNTIRTLGLNKVVEWGVDKLENYSNGVNAVVDDISEQTLAAWLTKFRYVAGFTETKFSLSMNKSGSLLDRIKSLSVNVKKTKHEGWVKTLILDDDEFLSGSQKSLKKMSQNSMKDVLKLMWGSANDQAQKHFKQALGLDPMSKTLDILNTIGSLGLNKVAEWGARNLENYTNGVGEVVTQVSDQILDAWLNKFRYVAGFTETKTSFKLGDSGSVLNRLRNASLNTETIKHKGWVQELIVDDDKFLSTDGLKNEVKSIAQNSMKDIMQLLWKKSNELSHAGFKEAIQNTTQSEWWDYIFRGNQSYDYTYNTYDAFGRITGTETKHVNGSGRDGLIQSITDRASGPIGVIHNQLVDAWLNKFTWVSGIKPDTGETTGKGWVQTLILDDTQFLSTEALQGDVKSIAQNSMKEIMSLLWKKSNEISKVGFEEAVQNTTQSEWWDYIFRGSGSYDYTYNTYDAYGRITGTETKHVEGYGREGLIQSITDRASGPIGVIHNQLVDAWLNKFTWVSGMKPGGGTTGKGWVQTLILDDTQFLSNSKITDECKNNSQWNMGEVVKSLWKKSNDVTKSAFDEATKEETADGGKKHWWDWLWSDDGKETVADKKEKLIKSIQDKVQPVVANITRNIQSAWIEKFKWVAGGEWGRESVSYGDGWVHKLITEDESFLASSQKDVSSILQVGMSDTLIRLITISRDANNNIWNSAINKYMSDKGLTSSAFADGFLLSANMTSNSYLGTSEAENEENSYITNSINNVVKAIGKLWGSYLNSMANVITSGTASGDMFTSEDTNKIFDDLKTETTDLSNYSTSISSKLSDYTSLGRLFNGGNFGGEFAGFKKFLYFTKKMTIMTPVAMKQVSKDIEGTYDSVSSAMSSVGSTLDSSISSAKSSLNSVSKNSTAQSFFSGKPSSSGDFGGLNKAAYYMAKLMLFPVYMIKTLSKKLEDSYENISVSWANVSASSPGGWGGFGRDENYLGDSRLANKPYAGATLAKAGCGPIAASKALRNIGMNASVEDVANYATAKGYANSNIGTDSNFIQGLSQETGVGVNSFNGNDQRSLDEALASGKQVIANGSNFKNVNMPYTSRGHYVNILGKKGDKYFVENTNGTSGLYSWKDIGHISGSDPNEDWEGARQFYALSGSQDGRFNKTRYFGGDTAYTKGEIAITNLFKSLGPHLAYGQGNSKYPKPRNVLKGSSDCSDSVRWAYEQVFGIDVGGYTGAQEKTGTIVKRDVRNADGLRPGDLLQFDGHVEMYTGPGDTMYGHGGGSNGQKYGPTEHHISTYGKYAKSAHRYGIQGLMPREVNMTLPSYGKGTTFVATTGDTSSGSVGSSSSTDGSNESSSSGGRQMSNFTSKLTESISGVSKEFLKQYGIEDLSKFATDVGNVFLNIADPEVAGSTEGSSNSSGSATLNGNNDKEKIWNYLTSNGYSKYATAGIMGCWDAESSNNPNTVEGHYLKGFPGFDAVINDRNTMNNYTTNTLFPAYAKSGISINKGAYKGNDGNYYPGIGLAQWTGPRGFNLFEHSKESGKNWGSLDNQLSFFSKEMTNKSSLKSNLNNANSVDNATSIFLDGFEMYNGFASSHSKEFNKRKDYANKIYNSYASGGSGFGGFGGGTRNKVHFNKYSGFGPDAVSTPSVQMSDYRTDISDDINKTLAAIKVAKEQGATSTSAIDAIIAYLKAIEENTRKTSSNTAASNGNESSIIAALEEILNLTNTSTNNNTAVVVAEGGNTSNQLHTKDVQNIFANHGISNESEAQKVNDKLRKIADLIAKGK